MNAARFYLFISSLLFIACSKERIPIIDGDGDDDIKFSVGISNNANTKITTSSDFKTVFDDNDTVGLFIYIRNDGEERSIETNTLYVDNIKLIYCDGVWELEEPIYYPDSKILLDIYAYYPYRENAQADSLEYIADTETDELLMASVIGIKKSENAINITFQHMQSLVYVTLSKNSNVPDFDENLNVYFNGVIGGRYNIATKELSEPLTGIIKMRLMGEANANIRGYAAYIPQQEAAPGILFSFFQLTFGHEILSSKDIDQPEIFTSGHVKMYNIRINQEISKDIRYQQYDLYPRYGTPVGMVVETYNGGKNGKVISLRNITETQWAIPNAASYETLATDYNDGISNKMKIQAIPDWEINYPAFYACVAYGERWYLPSIGEMRFFMSTLLNRVNQELDYHRQNNEELDIQLIHTSMSYFSSTENNATTAMKLYTGNGQTPSDPKDYEYYIRPFYEF